MKKTMKTQCTICKKMFADCKIVSHIIHDHDRKPSEATNIVRRRKAITKVRPKNLLKPYYSKRVVIKDLEKIIEKLKK